MDIDYIYCMIIDIIKKHRDLGHAINQHKITKIINDNNWCGEDDFIEARGVRRMIEELIKLGNPIISSPGRPGGYCWGGGLGEALKCANRLHAKGIKNILRSMWTMRNIEKGQLDLFEIKKQIRYNGN